MADSTPHQDQFESLARQREAATLGMWVFLASELLFFGALFTVYAAYRAGAPAAFAHAIAENTLYWGSTNTVVLLTSSFVLAVAVHQLRRGRPRSAARLALATAALGVVFLVIKAWEYHRHFSDGIFPGNPRGHLPGATGSFWTLYFLMTGLHALHVIIGIGALLVSARQIVTGSVDSREPQSFENVGLYWHLVDIIWLFLWPLFYLTR